MALPTTVKANAGTLGHHPPVKAPNGAFYVVGFDSSGSRAAMYKATDPTASWSEQDAGNRPAFIAEGIATVLAGSTIHVLLPRKTGFAYKSFNTTDDTWNADFANPSFNATEQSHQVWGSIAVRSNGDVVVVYNAQTDRVMGGDKERVDYAVRPNSTGTWDIVDTALDNAGDIHYGNPNCVLGTNGMVHCLWQTTSNTADPPTAWTDTQALTVDSADDLLESTNGSGVANFDTSDGDSGGALLGFPNLITYDDAGTQRIIVSGYLPTAGTTLSTVQGTEDGSDYISLTATGLTETQTAGKAIGELNPLTFAALDTDIHGLYSGGGSAGVDQDIYYTTSIDDGASWTDSEELDAVTCTYISASIYVRGSDTVLAYLYDDFGTQKYNEKILIAGAADNISTPPSQALTLSPKAPSAVTTEKNISLLASAAIALTAFAPNAETFDPNISELANQALTVTAFAPDATTTDNNFSQLPGATLTITPYNPQAITTEKHISELPSAALTVSGSAPDAVTTEKHISDLPSQALTLTAFAPDAVVAANNSSDLASQILTLTAFAPQAVATENNFSQLASQALTLTAFAPSAVTFDPNTSQLTSQALTLTAFTPSAVTFDPNTSQLTSQALTLTAFAPQVIATENNFSQLASQALALTAFAPQAATTENNVSELASQALTLTAFAPDAVTTEGASNTSQLASQALTLTAFAPSAVTFDPNTSQLTSQALTLTAFAPSAVTFDPNTSQLTSQALTLTAFAPSAVTTELNYSLLPNQALTLTAFAPNAVTSEGASQFVDMASQALTLTAFAPQTVVTELNYSQLPSQILTLTAFAPQAVATENNVSKLPSASGGGADPFINDVVLVVDFSEGTDGVDYDGSTPALGADQSNSAHTITYNAQVTGDNTQSKFGTVTMTPADAIAQGVVTGTLTDFDFGTDDWTIEYWQRAIAINNQGFCGLDLKKSSVRQLSVGTIANGSGGNVKWGIVGESDALHALTAGVDLIDDTWQHIAFCRDGGTVYFYIDGDLAHSDATAANITGIDEVSIIDSGTDSFINGDVTTHTDSLRITKGVARYPGGTSFGVPTAKFPTAGGLLLTAFAPNAVTTEGVSNTSQLTSQALTLTAFAPSAVTFDPNTSQLPSQALTLTAFAPSAVTTELNHSQLPSQALTLTAFAPDAVTTEGASQFVDMASQALTLTAFAPQAVTTELNYSQLPSQILTLTPFAPNAITSEGANQFVDMASQALTLTAFAPSAVTFDPNTSQLPSQVLTLTAFAPQAITTDPNISQLNSAALTLTGFSPSAVTFDPNTSQLASAALTIAGFAPQAVTTENNSSQLASAALTLTGSAPQSVITEHNYSQLASASLTLTAYAPVVVIPDPSKRLFIVT